jgi:hypothetical protein
MSDPTKEFFEALRQRGHEPLLEAANGSLRLEVAENGRTSFWYVSVEHGDVTVTHERRRADSTIKIDKRLSDRLVSGKENAMAAVLRGAISVEGDPQMLMLFQRLFPGPQSEEER